MPNPDATRQELRAILADPDSTHEQTLQVKLLLARRIADGPNRVRQICERYGLSPEKAAALIAGHQGWAGELEAWAAQQVQALERSSAHERTEARPEPPDS